MRLWCDGICAGPNSCRQNMLANVKGVSSLVPASCLRTHHAEPARVSLGRIFRLACPRKVMLQAEQCRHEAVPGWFFGTASPENHCSTHKNVAMTNRFSHSLQSVVDVCMIELYCFNYYIIICTFGCLCYVLNYVVYAFMSFVDMSCMSFWCFSNPFDTPHPMIPSASILHTPWTP